MWTMRSYESQDSGVVVDHLDMPEFIETTILEEGEEDMSEDVRKTFLQNKIFPLILKLIMCLNYVDYF